MDLSLYSTLLRRQLLDAVRRRDREALFSMTAPEIRTSFGAGSDREDLLERWDELEWVLTRGGTFRNGMFWAPYVYSTWPESRDAFQYLAVVGDDVPLRAEPREDARDIARLSYNLVKRVAERDRWIEIETDDGTRGWLPEGSLRSPIGYRAGFDRPNGEWKLVAFVAGD